MILKLISLQIQLKTRRPVRFSILKLCDLRTKTLKQIKKAGWQFNWGKELRDKTKEVYKLTTVNNPTIIQGLLSIEDKARPYVYALN